MEYTTLGQTDIRISRICLGTMTWGAQNTRQEAFDQMDLALDYGVQFWDTAEMYGVPPTPETYGGTEKIIGDWFAHSARRDEVVLATKFSPMPWARGADLAAPTGQSIAMAVDASLKRLQTDYIDLYQLHWPVNRPVMSGSSWWGYLPPQQKDAGAQIKANIQEVLEALQQQVDAGKIRQFGLSNDTSWGICEHLKTAEKLGLQPIASLQNEYSLIRRHIEHNIAETCAIEQISFLGWSPLAMGILSGKYLNAQRPKGSRFSSEVMKDQFSRFATRFSPAVDKATESYLAIARKYQIDPCQMAIKFTIRHPYLSSTIIGATSREQLINNIEAVDLNLTQDIAKDIDQVYRNFPVPF